jgi:hypothetical protein
MSAIDVDFRVDADIAMTVFPKKGSHERTDPTRPDTVDDAMIVTPSARTDRGQRT